MPAKVSVNARPMVTAGLANDVEEANQYARADVRADRGGCQCGSSRTDQGHCRFRAYLGALDRHAQELSALGAVPTVS